MASATGTSAKVTEDMIEAILKDKGVEYAPRYQFNEYASKDGLRHWVEGIGDPNPLFYDEEYAKSTRWAGIINHPTFYFSTAFNMGPQGLPGIHALYTGTNFEFYHPLRVGDRIAITGCLHDLIEKRSQFAGRMFQQIRRITYRNQHGETTAIAYSHAMRTERDTAREKRKYADISVHRYTDPELEQIDACLARELNETWRGRGTRFWESVAIGDDMGTIVRGPLTVTDVIAFKTGWGWLPYCRTGWYAWDYRRRHPAAYPRSAESNVPDVAERVHWDDGFAKEIGAPAPYDYGPQRISWAASLMTHWAGDDGWLRKLNTQVRRFNILGDATWVRGRVTDKRVDGAEHLVDCDVWCENQDGAQTLVGTAVIVLPSNQTSGHLGI